MEVKEIKEQWNKGLTRVNKAEKLAENNPNVFEMYIDEYHKICINMSRLMNEYKKLTGSEICEPEFSDGFKDE